MPDLLTFDQGYTKSRKIRRVPEKYLESTLRPNIDQSDGIRPPVVFIPHRSLKTKFQDRSTEQYVVIPKGRLVSAYTIKNSAADVFVGVNDANGNAINVKQDDHYFGVPRTTLGLLAPANGGVAATYTYDADDVSAEVPNGANTDLTGFTFSSESDVVAANDTLQIAANAPIGAVFQDVFQDIRGQYLNFDTFKNYGIVASQTFLLPFIDVNVLGDQVNMASTLWMPKGFDNDLAGTAQTMAAAPADLTGADPAVAGDNSATHTKVTDSAHGLEAGDVITISGAVAGDGDEDNVNDSFTVVTVIDANNFVIELAYADADGADISAAVWARADAAATGAGYAAVEKYFTFLTINSENDAHGKPGSFLQSDLFGNYVPQYKTLSSNTRNVQTVGRVLGFDSRFPKDLLHLVQSGRYEEEPLARVAGAATEGLSEHLYWFAVRALDGASYSWPAGTDKSKTVRDLVQAGAFGMAWIQLSVR